MGLPHRSLAASEYLQQHVVLVALHIYEESTLVDVL